MDRQTNIMNGQTDSAKTISLWLWWGIKSIYLQLAQNQWYSLCQGRKVSHQCFDSRRNHPVSFHSNFQSQWSGQSVVSVKSQTNWPANKSFKHCNYVLHNIENLFHTFPNKPWFVHDCSTSLLITLWEKEKLLIMSNFSFSHSGFYQFGEFSAIFIKFKIVGCKSLWIGRV